MHLLPRRGVALRALARLRTPRSPGHSGQQVATSRERAATHRRARRENEKVEALRTDRMAEESPTRIKFQVAPERVLEILSSEIYDSPYAMVRENVQNAYDAVLMRAAVEPG